MELVVDLDRVVVTLAGPEDIGTVTVRVRAPRDASPAAEATVHRLADVLAATYTGRLDPSGVAFVRPDALRFHAAGQVDEEWEARFSAWCAAEAPTDRGGATGDDGGSLRAQVVWPPRRAAAE